jgi:hypothetical protein
LFGFCPVQLFLRNNAGQIWDILCGTSFVEVKGKRTQSYLRLINMRNLHGFFGGAAPNYFKHLERHFRIWKWVV